MATFDQVSNVTKIRAALHRDVRAICTECCHFLGLDITKDAMEIIAELLHGKLAVYSTDLEAFAKHAKRAQINTDDVKLLVRRNPTLKSHLNAISSNTTVTKEKRRKTIASASKQPETPLVKSKELEAPATTPKETSSTIESRPSTSKFNDVEAMVVDDAIDLTFDE